ncbi:MAG: hypothetical protein JWN34_3737 [Bryobacterales bacterium]|nr:hypothetical protein [Bryobacterales bacterium]
MNFPRARAALACHCGSALVESALLLPLLLVMMMNTMNFSTFVFGWITVANAARAAAEYKVYNGIVVGANGPAPANASVQTMAQNDATSLPAGVTVTVCSSFKRSASCAPNQDDSEPDQYTSWTVDVAWSYTPVFTPLSLISAQTIHRTVVMRSMQ